MANRHPVVVVGAGIAGVACARLLADAGVAVSVLDRGHRVGGRMASRTIGGRPVDLGASYFTVSDPSFEIVVDRWRERGLAHPWTDTFMSLSGDEKNRVREVKSGPMRWGADHGTRSLVEDLAHGLEVTSNLTVESIGLQDGLRVDGRPAAAVVLAMPDPQALRLLDDSLVAERRSLDQDFEPVLALSATFATRGWDLDGAFINEDPVLDWVADDGRRRGDDAPVLVAHSSSDFAARWLSEPQGAAESMVHALRRCLPELDEPVATHVHRWTFARPTAGRDLPYFLSTRNVGVCGDAWTDRPRVEGAFLSGRQLGEALVERLG